MDVLKELRNDAMKEVFSSIAAEETKSASDNEVSLKKKILDKLNAIWARFPRGKMQDDFKDNAA